MDKKITVSQVLTEGLQIGLANAASIIGAVALWLVTIWIPYLNVGTTIAIYSMPLELSKGGIMSPTSIFDGKYRQYMGEFFALIGLMLLSIIPALFFAIIPAVIISIGWSLAIYLLLDKGVSPSDALVMSNKATYGYKWTIFGVGLVQSLIYGVIYWILLMIFGDSGTFLVILVLILEVLFVAFTIGCNAVIYRNLTAEPTATDEEPTAPETEPTAPETEPSASNTESTIREI